MKFLFIEFFSLALSLDNLKGILSFSPDANKSKRLDVVEKKTASEIWKRNQKYSKNEILFISDLECFHSICTFLSSVALS